MPSTVLKCEAAVPLLDLYIDIIIMQRAATVQSHFVKENICQILKSIQRAKAPQKDIIYKYIS